MVLPNKCKNCSCRVLYLQKIKDRVEYYECGKCGTENQMNRKSGRPSRKTQ